jgi:hypothetical protein
MAIIYALGDERGSRKPKKMKRPTTPEEAGKESREKRLKRFSPEQNKQVADTIERNVNVKEAIKKGAVLNTQGNEPGYQGDQRYKQLTRKKIKIMPKYRKSSDSIPPAKKITDSTPKKQYKIVGTRRKLPNGEYQYLNGREVEMTPEEIRKANQL